ncbi:MAG: hypothetical protein JW727_04230 [Candidatus Aenigmarchaeota archaeon]|nr:hypothetical protein [Candidatus Aenigmarchaeota archaeon]
MKSAEVRAIYCKVALFAAIAYFFRILTPDAGYVTYTTLLVIATLWLIYELMQPEKRRILKPALTLGFFLMALDFILQNLGFYAGLWSSPNSVFTVLAVPIEIMALALIGGSAWALHLPDRPDHEYISIEIMIFSVFGAIGEHLLILNGMMAYSGAWTAVHAFFGYVIVWMVLFQVWYAWLRKERI